MRLLPRPGCTPAASAASCTSSRGAWRGAAAWARGLFKTAERRSSHANASEIELTLATALTTIRSPRPNQRTREPGEETMSSYVSRKRLLLLLVWALATLAGCAGRETPKENVSAQASSATPAPAPPAAPVQLDPRWHQSFAEATVEEPPADWQRPPDL